MTSKLVETLNQLGELDYSNYNPKGDDDYIYEIRANKYLGTGSSSIGYFFKFKENAEERCKELNKLMNVYFVAPVKLLD